MTSTFTIAITLFLLLNEITYWDDKIISEDDPSSNLIFIISCAIFLKRTTIVPQFLQRLYPLLYFIEIPLATLWLHFCLIYAWFPLRNLIMQHADDLLVTLSENHHFERFFCYFFCGKINCCDIFARLILKTISLTFLVTACCYRRICSVAG